MRVSSPRPHARTGPAASGALLCALLVSGCFYVEAGGGATFPSSSSTSSSEASIGGAIGIAADIRTGPFQRGLRLAGGLGTSTGVFSFEDRPVTYISGRYHLRLDQTFWVDAPMYLRWMVAAELGGSACWQNDLMEEAAPLDGSGWAVMTGPTISIGFEGEGERELESDGSAHFTLAFHYSRIDTSQGTVGLPAVQLRLTFDYNIGGAMAEAMKDGMN